MSDKKEIVIKDACILFDLVDLDLLGHFFSLAVMAMTTPQVIGEITDEQQLQAVSAYIDNGLLQVDNSGEYEAILKISEGYPGLSTADSSVLELALRKDAIIFSSDGLLRKISTRKELTVRGVLWIIEQLYTEGIITKDMALEKLQVYSEINARAPKKEIDKLLEKLKE
ncbi:MAG: hypothetical protein ACTHOF_01230 [Flavisolibacter sp.]